MPAQLGSFITLHLDTKATCSEESLVSKENSTIFEVVGDSSPEMSDNDAKRLQRKQEIEEKRQRLREMRLKKNTAAVCLKQNLVNLNRGSSRQLYLHVTVFIVYAFYLCQ